MARGSSWLVRSWPASLNPVTLAFGMPLLMLCVLLTWRPVGGFQGFWAHAAVGRWICEHGEVPRQGLFLWTASEPWVAHCWLTGVLFYGLTCLADADRLPYLVFGVAAVLVAVPFALAWDLWRRRGPLGAWVVIPFYFALDLAYPRFNPRPELFTMLLLAVQLRLLVAWSAGAPQTLTRADTARAVALVLLMVPWANLHGAMIVGLLMLGVTAVLDLLQDRGRRARMLALLVPLAALATLATPYGLAYWQAYRAIPGETFRRIQEWQPLWRLDDWGAIPFDAPPLLGLAVAAWAGNPARRWAHLGWLTLAAGLLVCAVRNIHLLAVVCLMVTAANAGTFDLRRLWNLLPWRGEAAPAGRHRPVPVYLRCLVGGALLVWLSIQIVYRWHVLAVPCEPIPQRLSRGAVAFIQAQQPPGRLFNDYENSPYLLWCFAGEPQLFIDALNAYPDGVTRDYCDIANVNERGRALLNGDRIDWVLLTTNRPGPSLAQLGAFLDTSPEWMRIYADGDGVIWVRRNRETEQRWRSLAATVNKTNFFTFEQYNSHLGYEWP
jgi:hypothetical protein